MPTPHSVNCHPHFCRISLRGGRQWFQTWTVNKNLSSKNIHCPVHSDQTLTRARGHNKTTCSASVARSSDIQVGGGGDVRGTIMIACPENSMADGSVRRL